MPSKNAPRFRSSCERRSQGDRMTLTIREIEPEKFALECDGKPVAYVRGPMLEQLVQREGGAVELWPAQGVLRYVRQQHSEGLPF